MAACVANAGVDRESMRIRTTDVRECRDYFRAAEGGAHHFDIARAPSFGDFEHHAWSLGRISLNRIDISCNADFTVTKAAPVSFFQFNFVLDGDCEVRGRQGRFVAHAGDIFVVDPEQPATEFWHHRMAQYLLRIDRRIVENALAGELGAGLSRHLVFEPVTPDPGISSWLHQIASSAANGAQSLLADRRVMKSVEDTLITMLLAGSRHSESDMLARKSAGLAPYYVKRAEEHIRAHVRDELSIEHIAAAAKVSTRTLFYGFKRWRGKSPMAFVRDARLDMARKELEQGQELGTTVSKAAINAGFTNFSQFSRIYKARFGETPSTTLLGH
jgi:AraC-like DNA-binding protein